MVKKTEETKQYHERTLGLKIELDELEMNKARFALFHYPVLIYNEQLGTVVTKDFLSEQEKISFAEHGVLYLNRKMEELTSVVRDFGRYVVELTKPQGGSIFTKWWVWVIVIILVALLVIMFAPSVMKVMGATVSSASGAVQTATAGGNPVTIR